MPNLNAYEARGWYYGTAVLWGLGLIAYPWMYGTLDKAVAWVLWAPAPVAFFAVLAGMACFLVAIGLSVTGLRRGIMLGSRNMFSLSRLQMVLWTWLILSALIATAAARAWGLNGIAAGTGLHSALSITLHGDLLAVMGISFTSAAISPAILKFQARGATASLKGSSMARHIRGSAYVHGKVIYRVHASDASFEDLIKGDDTDTGGAIDLGKVQNLLLTLILVTYYLLMLFDMFANSGLFNVCDKDHRDICVTKFPDFSSGMVTFLAISHSGYLAYKAAPKPGQDARGQAPGFAGPAVVSDDGPAMPPDMPIDDDEDEGGKKAGHGRNARRKRNDNR